VSTDWFPDFHQPDYCLKSQENVAALEEFDLYWTPEHQMPLSNYAMYGLGESALQRLLVLSCEGMKVKLDGRRIA